MKNNGSEDWDQYPSYLDIFVPYILELCKDLDIILTFFIVGQDAAFEKNHIYLKMIADAGHEIANHSFKHDTYLHLYTKEELEEEINKAHATITAATGKEPVGFRGPGFTWSETLLEVLEEKGYQYDSSTFPTFIGPLLRMYYFKSSSLSKAEKKERKNLFGKFSDGFQKLKPHFKKLKNKRRLLEIPVTTMPLFRIPIHLTYLMYLSMLSKPIMFLYLKSAIYLCKLTRTSPIFLIHPTDLLGEDMVSEMEFFPGMEIPSQEKLVLFKKIIKIFSKHFTLTTIDNYAAETLNKHDKNVMVAH